MKSISAVALSLALSDVAQAVRFLGRVNPATRELTWPGTGVAFSFTGSSATIDFESVTGTIFYMQSSIALGHHLTNHYCYRREQCPADSRWKFYSDTERPRVKYIHASGTS